LRLIKFRFDSLEKFFVARMINCLLEHEEKEKNLFDTRVRLLTLRLLALSIVFLTPLIYFTPTKDQFELPKLLFLGLAASMMLILSLTLRQKPFLGPLGASLLLLLAAQTVSSLPQVSLSWQASLLGDYENFSGLATFLTYLSCFFAFLAAFHSRRAEKPFFFISLSALLSALYAVAQHYGLDFVKWDPSTVNSIREFASLGNPNFLSAFLAMALPLWLAWLNTREAKGPSFPSPAPVLALLLGLCFLYLGAAQGYSYLHPEMPGWLVIGVRILGLSLFAWGLAFLIFSLGSWFALPAVACLGVGLVCTGSRGGFIAAFLGGFVYFVLTFTKRNPQTTPSLPKCRLLLKGIVLLTLLAPSLWIGRPFLERFYHSLTHPGESLSISRLQIWIPALKMVEAHPLWGVGLDTFKTAFPSYSDIKFNQIDGMNVSSRLAHNGPLQLASTTGLVGLGAYLLLWGVFFFLSFRFWRTAGTFQKTLAAGIIGCAAAYHLQNLFSFDVAALGMASFWLLAGIESFSPLSFSNQKGFFVSSSLRGGFAFSFIRSLCMGLLVLFGLFLSLTRLPADLAFGQAEAVSEYLKKPNPESQPQVLLEYSNWGIESCQKAISLCPLEVKYRLYLGLAYEERAALDRDKPKPWLEAALDSYRRALSISPNNGYYYNDVGRVCQDLADLDPSYRSQAVEAYQKAVQFGHSSPAFWVNLALAQRENGKTEEANQALIQAFKLDSASTAKSLAQSAVLDFQSGRKTDALEKLETAMAGNTTVAEPYFYRGLMEMEDHQYGRALDDFHEAKKRVDPANPGVMSNLDAFIQQSSSIPR
jgi:tetratricopeptide (TPR) repeat protein